MRLVRLVMLVMLVRLVRLDGRTLCAVARGESDIKPTKNFN